MARQQDHLPVRRCFFFRFPEHAGIADRRLYSAFRLSRNLDENVGPDHGGECAHCGDGRYEARFQMPRSRTAAGREHDAQAALERSLDQYRVWGTAVGAFIIQGEYMRSGLRDRTGPYGKEQNSRAV